MKTKIPYLTLILAGGYTFAAYWSITYLVVTNYEPESIVELLFRPAWVDTFTPGSISWIAVGLALVCLVVGVILANALVPSERPRAHATGSSKRRVSALINNR